jgi:heavy metal translocating P-type ATPase
VQSSSITIDRLVSKSSVKKRLPFLVLVFLAAGAATYLFPHANIWRSRIWMVGLIITSVPILATTVRGMLRGVFAADLVAALAVLTSALLGQPVVGLVIVLMQSGGEALESYAEGKASEALRALENAAPSTVHRIREDLVEDVDVNLVREEDTVLVRPGEMIPCDGEVFQGTSHVDTSSLTGEPMPERVSQGAKVMSGYINRESPLVIRVLAIARESQYARIVQLVREAQTTKAPLQRIADRYAVWFTPITIILCAASYALSQDWSRVLAVLAIATPCPLILATPVAILGGMNRSARHQILVRNGSALEALGTVTAVLFDKTGTITIGRPHVSRVVAVNSISENKVLYLASAVEQGSGHLLARTLVNEAEARSQLASPAMNVIESPGRGVQGEAEGMSISVGARSFIAEHHPASRTALDRTDEDGNGQATLRAYVAVDGKLAGLIEYSDSVRPGMSDLIGNLKQRGIQHVILLSGDRTRNARAIADSVGIDEARGDMLPEDKVEVVRRLLQDGESVVMIGDGTNDAPALSTATVGVALASHGRGIATEAADVILLADDPSRLLKGIDISRRTMRIARQSIWVGLGISVIGMALAANGLIAPLAGAGIQEVVDLAVIVNALRASRDSM